MAGSGLISATCANGISSELLARHQNARHPCSRRADRWHFYLDGKRVFGDVHNPDKTVVIELKQNDTTC
jgi:hypothetical protein